MVAATKKKRGRPTIQVYADAYQLNNGYGAYNRELSYRALQNKVNAEYFIVNVLIDHAPDLELFFMTQEGTPKHYGIAEQIGRLLRRKLISIEQAIDITQQAIDEYNHGATSKQIEWQIRQYRMNLQKEGE